MSKWVRIRFIVWLVFTIGILSSLAWICIVATPLNSNIMDLLPQAKKNTSLMQASQQFTKTMGQQLVFLVGNLPQNQAQAAADIFAKQLQTNSNFSKISYQVSTSAQQAWASFYFPYRLSLLTPMNQYWLKQHNTNKIIQSALFNIYNPMAVTNSALLKTDPYFLFQQFIMALPQPAKNVQLLNGYMMVPSNTNKWYVMINATMKSQSFSLTTQNNILHTINQATYLTKQYYPTISIIKTGMLFYAQAGAEDAQHDITLIGLGSILGIIILLLLTFRSLSPLCNILIASFIGFAAAFVTTYFIFGSIYVFTLALGASLIGISVDYAFFYYTDRLFSGKNWNSVAGLKRIISGISLGLINVLLAFGIIAFAPFPGLRQLAVFAIAGLTVSYLTVVCVFPYLLEKPQLQGSTSFMVNIVTRYLQIWLKASPKMLWIGLMGLIIVIVLGLTRLKTNDDIHQLQSIPVQLQQQEKQLKQLIGSHFSTNFIVVGDSNPQKVLTETANLSSQLKQQFPEISNPAFAVSDYLPPIATQKINYQLTKQQLIEKNLLAYLKQIGVQPLVAKKIQQDLLAIPFQGLSVNNWLNSSVSDSLNYLWVEQTNYHAAIILLAENLAPTKVRALTSKMPNAMYINQATNISTIFKIYRQLVTQLLGLAFIALLCLLIWRYGIIKAIYYFIPPLASVFFAVAGLGLLGISLTLFNLLALILVLGISVDYVLFFAENKSIYQSTMLATLLSACTTILSFGLLALSSTPVIHDFGITITLGITAAVLLSPLAVRVDTREETQS